MKLEQALKLQVLDLVRCPADRGELPYTGRVWHIDRTVHKNIRGVEFIWITVRHPMNTKSSVWPSNRLG